MDQIDRILILDNYDRFVCSFYGATAEAIIGWDGETLIKQPIGEAEKITGRIKPLLEIPLLMKPYFLNLLRVALSEQDVKSEEESVLKGELRATKLHLQDLQMITKKLLKL